MHITLNNDVWANAFHIDSPFDYGLRVGTTVEATVLFASDSHVNLRLESGLIIKAALAAPVKLSEGETLRFLVAENDGRRIVLIPEEVYEPGRSTTAPALAPQGAANRQILKAAGDLAGSPEPWLVTGDAAMPGAFPRAYAEAAGFLAANHIPPTPENLEVMKAVMSPAFHPGRIIERVLQLTSQPPFSEASGDETAANQTAGDRPGEYSDRTPERSEAGPLYTYGGNSRDSSGRADTAAGAVELPVASKAAARAEPSGEAATKLGLNGGEGGEPKAREGTNGPIFRAGPDRSVRFSTQSDALTQRQGALQPGGGTDGKAGASLKGAPEKAPGVIFPEDKEAGAVYLKHIRSLEDLLFFQMEGSSGSSLRSFARHLPQRLELLHGYVSASGLKRAEEGAHELGRLMTGIRLLKALSCYACIQIPLRSRTERGTAVLFVVRRRRRAREAGRPVGGEIRAILKLDMEHLGHIEVFIAIAGDRVSLRFRSERGRVAEYIQNRSAELNKLLSGCGYRLSDMRCEVSPEETGPVNALQILSGDGFGEELRINIKV